MSERPVNLFTFEDQQAFLDWRQNKRGQKINISVGPRYVFFKSLATQKQKLYNQYLYNQGMNYVNQIKSQFIRTTNTTDDEIQPTLSKMQQYTNFINEMAKTEIKNEQTFLNKMEKQLEDKQKLTDELRKEFDSFKQDPSNYKNLIALLNKVLKQNTEEQKRRDALYLNNAKLIQEKINTAQNTQKQSEQKNIADLQQLFHNNIHIFHQQLNKILKQAEDGNNWRTTYAQLVSNRINSTLTIILHSPQVLEQFENYYNQTGGQVKNFSGKVISYIVDYINNFSLDDLQTRSRQDIANEVINSINLNDLNRISSNYVDLIMNQMTQRSSRTKTIEQLAFTTGRGTARFYAEIMTSVEREDIKDRYFGNLNSKERKIFEDFENNLNNLENFSTYKLGQVSKIMNQQIRKYFSSQLSQQVMAQITDAFRRRDQLQAFNLMRINNQLSALQQALRVQISSPNIGEIQTSTQVTNALKDILLDNYTPGHSISLKNDITLLFSFNKHIYSNNIDVQMHLQNLVKSFPKSFIKQYAKDGGGSQDVIAAENAYLTTAKKLLNDVEELRKQDLITEEEKQNFLNSLKDYILNGISVKEYHYVTNYGFHGGTIGSNLTKIVDNVTEMYNLGGISTLDADLLYFAIANCGDQLLGSDLKQDIQTYLLGAAAIMMFDEGFASTQGFLERMKAQLGFTGPTGLHLFKVPGAYVPASFIYQKIGTALTEITEDISADIDEVIKNSDSAITINNTIQRNNIPSFFNVPEPQDRWDAVAAYAEKTLEGENAISYTFLAGIIDILKQVQEAFKV